MTYYPSCLQQSEYCNKCDTAQTVSNACTSSRSRNSSSNKQDCSVFCNNGCNSSCNTAQTVCIKMGQYIKDHADVGDYNGSIVQKDDFIHEKWTVDYWTNLKKKLESAESVGRLKSQGSGGPVTAEIKQGACISADLYNQIGAKLASLNSSIASIKKDDLITAAIANAIGTAYNNAKFNSNVCDMCNSDQTLRGGCGCNCSCPCSCNCGCSCTCSCGHPKPPDSKSSTNYS